MAHTDPVSQRLQRALDSIRQDLSGCWEWLDNSLASLPPEERWELMTWIYHVVASGVPDEDSAVYLRMAEIWSRVKVDPCLQESFDPYEPEEGCEDEPISFHELFAFVRGVIHASLEPDARGELEIYRDDTWRIVRLDRPEMILRHWMPQKEIGSERLTCALWIASHQGIWVVERRGQKVMQIRDSGDGDSQIDTILWADPTAMEVLLAHNPLQAFPMWLREEIWDRLIELVRGERPEAHDRPETAKRCRGIVREKYLAAVQGEDEKTAYEIAKESRFWNKTRDELLEAEPGKHYELWLWGKILRIPRELRSDNDLAKELDRFARRLRAAAIMCEWAEDEMRTHS